MMSDYEDVLCEIAERGEETNCGDEEPSSDSDPIFTSSESMSVSKRPHFAMADSSTTSSSTSSKSQKLSITHSRGLLNQGQPFSDKIITIKSNRHEANM